MRLNIALRLAAMLAATPLIVACGTTGPTYPLNKYETRKSFYAEDYPRALAMAFNDSRHANGRLGGRYGIKDDLAFVTYILLLPSSAKELRAKYAPIAVASLERSAEFARERLEDPLRSARTFRDTTTGRAAAQRLTDQTWAEIAGSEALLGYYYASQGDAQRGAPYLRSFLAKASDERSYLKGYCEAALVLARMYQQKDEFVEMVKMIRTGLRGECVEGPHDDAGDVLPIRKFQMPIAMTEEVGLKTEANRIRSILAVAKRAEIEPRRAAITWNKNGYPEIAKSMVFLAGYYPNY